MTICLRHDGDVAGVDADRAPTTRIDQRVGSVGRVHPHVEVKIVDPADGPHRAARRAGRALHPRLLGDARLLERTRAHRGGDRRRRGGCTPATSPTMDDDGYVNIVGRIKDMIIRGGENVYPREIEEFLYTHPDDRRRAGDRRARRALRRGDHGLGRRPRRARRSRVDDVARVLPGHASRTTRCRATCTSPTSSR